MVRKSATNDGKASLHSPGRTFPSLSIAARNAVNIEDQMAKSAATQADFQMMTNLYKMQVGMIKTAIGRSS